MGRIGSAVARLGDRPGSTGRRSRRSSILRTLLAVLACGMLVVSVVGVYVAFEWVRAPGLDEVTPNSADARVRAAEQRPGAPPPLHIPITWHEMPVSLRNATVAIEDQRFYRHGAVDIKGVVRAAVEECLLGRDA